jgi:hypothetical protein
VGGGKSNIETITATINFNMYVESWCETKCGYASIMLDTAHSLRYISIRHFVSWLYTCFQVSG